MDVFAKAWTFRSPQLTVTYPQGWKGKLPPERQEAAMQADALVPPPEPNPETPDAHNGDGQPARRKGRAREA